MRRMDPMEVVPIKSVGEFADMYNSNLELMDEVIDKLIVASNRQNRKIFMLSLICLGLASTTYVLMNQITYMRQRVDILVSSKGNTKKENEES